MQRTYVLLCISPHNLNERHTILIFLIFKNKIKEQSTKYMWDPLVVIINIANSTLLSSLKKKILCGSLRCMSLSISPLRDSDHIITH